MLVNDTHENSQKGYLELRFCMQGNKLTAVALVPLYLSISVLSLYSPSLVIYSLLTPVANL
jgi:hypothetical protein